MTAALLLFEERAWLSVMFTADASKFSNECERYLDNNMEESRQLSASEVFIKK